MGIVWPRELAPVDVHIVAAGKDETLYVKAEEIARDLETQGLLSSSTTARASSPGVKFKDSELIGVPTIVVVGRGLADGVVEIKDRRTGERTEVAVDDVVAAVVNEVTAAVQRP